MDEVQAADDDSVEQHFQLNKNPMNPTFVFVLIIGLSLQSFKDQRCVDAEDENGDQMEDSVEVAHNVEMADNVEQ